MRSLFEIFAPLLVLLHPRALSFASTHLFWYFLLSAHLFWYLLKNLRTSLAIFCNRKSHDSLSQGNLTTTLLPLARADMSTTIRKRPLIASSIGLDCYYKHKKDKEPRYLLHMKPYLMLRMFFLFPNLRSRAGLQP